MKAEISTPRQISKGWQRLAQGAWVLLALLALLFFLSEVGSFYGSLLTSSAGVQEHTAPLGMTIGTYAIYLTGLRSVYLLVHLVVAGILIFKRPGEGMAVFAAFFLVILGTTFWPLSEGGAGQPEAWNLPRAVANLAMSTSLLVFFLVFPDGRFIPRWTRYFAAVMFLLLVGENFAPGSPLNPRTWGMGAAALLSLLSMTVLVYVPVHRYRRVSNPVVRQQTKCVVYQGL